MALSFSLQHLLLFLLLHYSSTASPLLPYFLAINCTQSTPPPPPPQLHSIKIFLNYLTLQATKTRFTTLNVDQEPNLVNGLMQCRFDLSPLECVICIKTAQQTILSLCPNSDAVTTWFDTCYIHYYTHRKPYLTIDIIKTSPSNRSYVNDPARFSLALNRLFRQLRDRVSRGYSFGEIVYSNNGSKVYGLAECLRTVSAQECQTCIGNVTKKLHDFCGDKGGAIIVDGYCMVHFEIYRFFLFSEMVGGGRSDSGGVTYNENVSDGGVGFKIKVAYAWGIGVACVFGVVLGAGLLRRKIVNTAKVGIVSA